MPGAICLLEDASDQQPLGGKARGLAKLTAAGFSVPAGFVVMPDARDEEIVTAYRVLGTGPVAVRSSAEEEDSETHSYAGQFDTFLDVVGEQSVAEAVNACRASGSNPRAASYRGDGATRSAPIPVIVQRMVHPDYAGVAFATTEGATSVEGVPGLAAGLAAGCVSPSPVPRDIHERVERLARDVVERVGGAQDIEWAVEGDRTWLLQARAITAPLPAALPSQVRLWTAANVQEAIPRPLTPLSEELTLDNMSRIFAASFAFGGLPQPDGPVVRFVNGRVYMCYSALASAMSAMPGFRIETLLLMFGDGPELAPLIAYSPGAKRHFLLRLPATLSRSVAWLLFAERYIERAQEVADQFEQRVRSTVAGDPTEAQLLGLLGPMQARATALLDAMSISTSMANQLLGTVMSARAKPLEASSADAVAAVVTGELKSLEPARRLAVLAEWLRANPSLSDESAETQARLAEFMEACGFRCAEEAELANPRWNEQPDGVLRLARLMASAPAAPPCAVAERVITSLLRQPRRHVMSAQARVWQRRRERTRAALSRLGASARLLFLAIARRLHERRILDAPEDTFFLLSREIVSLLETPRLETADAGRLAARITRRRARYRRLLASPPSSRLLAELPDGRLVPFAPEPKGDALRGCGVSAGRVIGRARVMHDLEEIQTLEPGEVLVTRTTDIGWTPLFQIASAVITEIGAPTSHAAIVARELGLPAVVNVDRVTARIHTGDVLFVDGWAGLVRVKENSPSESWSGLTVARQGGKPR